MVAKPIGQQVFSEMFSVKSIEPDDQSQLSNQPNIVMPDLIGKTVAEACAILKHLDLNVNIEGLGGYVINQLPSVDTKIFTGEEVLIFTND
jgi:beta-lactam-binding protein with PASTA domain